MSYPHALSLPLSGMTVIVLLSLRKSIPSFKAQHSCNLLQEALPDCLAGNEVVAMEENRREESCIGVKKCPGNLKPEPRKCSLFFFILSHSGLRWEAPGLSVLMRQFAACLPDTPEHRPGLGRTAVLSPAPAR